MIGRLPSAGGLLAQLCRVPAGCRGNHQARLAAIRKAGPVASGATRNALERIREEEELRALEDIPNNFPPPDGAVVVRRHNGPAPSAGSTFPVQVYPAHPHNFTPLRAVAPGFSALDRAVRDLPFESRFDLLDRFIRPKFAGEGLGTPRREIQDGLVAGIRVRPVQNPYVKMTTPRKYRYNNWASKDWQSWEPTRANVRGSRRKYRLPEDIAPYRDELGEWHPPRVSGRYKADIEKQFYMNSLPWVWSKDFYQARLHFMDREPTGQKFWYRQQYRKAQIAEALKRADQLVEEYRKERRDKKRLSWIEDIVVEFAGEQMAEPYVRTRRLPKM